MDPDVNTLPRVRIHLMAREEPQVYRSLLTGAAAGAAAVLSFGCGASTQTPPAATATRSTEAGYSLLATPSTSRIDVVTLAQAKRAASSPARPIWVAVDPKVAEATLPEIRTAHQIRRDGPIRAWASRSNRGGLCVLLYDPRLSAHPATAHSVTASCGTAAELPRGIALVQHLGTMLEGRAFLVGLAPDGVPTVSVTFDDGRSQALPVVHNAYSLFAHRRIAGVSFVSGGVRHQTIP